MKRFFLLLVTATLFSCAGSPGEASTEVKDSTSTVTTDAAATVPDTVSALKRQAVSAPSSFLAEHPGLKAEQVVNYQAAAANEAIPAASMCPQLVWVRDEGNLAIMKATAYITVRVNHVRNGKFTGSVWIDMKPNDTLSLRQNNDNMNYDGFSC